MPISEKQLAANRANAAKSTGPRTPEGKARSARNGITHGFTASTFTVVRLEDLQEIANLKADLTAAYQPVNSQELFALERMALTQQAMLRAARLESGLFTTCLDIALDGDGRPFTPMHPELAGDLSLDGDLDITHAQNRNYALADGFHRMAKQANSWSLFLRYQAQTERLYRRAVEEFDRLRALRAELPSEPILDTQPEENTPGCAPPDEPILPLQPPVPEPPLNSMTDNQPGARNSRCAPEHERPCPSALLSSVYNKDMDSRVDPGKEPRLSRSLGSCFLFVIPAIFLALTETASGLDPGRSLTQYIHRIQQIQGLPQATIFSILQTHDGYLWLGTQRGLVRFDGVRFTSPESTNGVSLQDTWVRSLLEDDQHNVWVGSNDAGLVRLRDGVMTRYSTSASTHCLVPGRRGEFWVCTPNGLVRVVNGKFIPYGGSQGLSTVDIRAACQAADGRLWAGGDSSELNVWDGARFTRYALSSLPKNATVRAMLCSNDGAIWIGTTSGLIRLMNSKERLFTKADGLADEWVDTLAAGSGGSLWIGTKNGFSRFLNGEMESFQAKDGLSQSSVYAMHEDREGNLWVGTKHGLDQFFDGRTIPVTASEGLPSNDTGPVFQDHNGNIWVGTLGAGLGRFNGRRFSTMRIRNGPGGNTIRALTEGNTGGLWVGTDDGLQRLRNGRVERTYTTEDGLPANTIRCLFRDSHGELWAGTPKGAAVFRAGYFIQPHGRVSILTLGEDRQGRLFAAIEGGGIEIYAAGKRTEFLPNPAPARDVDALYTDRDGLLWMGTLGGGLRLLKEGKVFTFWMRDGLFDDDIYGIAGDDRDRLWMACSNGIFSVNRSELLKFADGAIKKFVSTPYIPTDALRTIECKPGVQPAVWKMRDGALWFSTIKGVIVLDPSRIDRKLAPPPVVIEEVTLNGQREEPRRIESMLPGRKNLGFRYTGLSYYSPSRITFRYKLDGFENNWTDAGARREALYANLPPGKFVFRVIACNVDGTCGSAGSSVAFALAPEYYQRTWFFPLCAGLIALSVWVLHRLRIRDFKAQFALILAERSRIARELHDTLIQGFSGVTMEMQALCAKLSSPEERRTLQEIVQDAARSLREARRSVAGLRGAPGAQSGLGSAIAQAARQITEAKDIRLKLELEQNSRELPAEIEYNLLRIAQEAVSNSVKHSGARMIEVSLQSTAALVSLAIKDDGSGFGLGTDGAAHPGHYGLIGMRERATHIGAGFQIDSESGRGTTVRVMLPAPEAGNGQR